MTNVPDAQATDGGPTYVGRGDPTGRFADYYPAWIDKLADDVTLEGSMLDGILQGSGAIRVVIGGVRELYDRQDVNFAGSWGDNGVIEEYTAEVDGRPLGCLHLIAFNADGQAQHLAAHFRPLSSGMFFSRLLRERLRNPLRRPLPRWRGMIGVTATSPPTARRPTSSSTMENDPKNWELEFPAGLIHVAVSVFSDPDEAWHRIMTSVRADDEQRPGLTVLSAQDSGAHPGDLNPLGDRDPLGQPAINGGGVDPLPGQGPAIKAGGFIGVYPAGPIAQRRRRPGRRRRGEAILVNNRTQAISAGRTRQ